MTSKFAYISLLLFMVLILGCKKDKVPCTSCPTGSGAGCEDIQNVKHFFYFKVGSWWVYEEENSGLRDSVYVTSAAENPSNYDFDVEVYSAYQDYTYRYWPEYYPNTTNGCPESGILCSRCMLIKRAKYKPGDFVDESRCFIFIPKIGDTQSAFNVYFPGNKIIVADIRDSIILNQFSLNTRTVVVNELNTFMEGRQPTNHYFNEGVGLVRKELLDSNEVWNLVDYHIEQ